jgi:hypothetical protein
MTKPYTQLNYLLDEGVVYIKESNVPHVPEKFIKEYVGIAYDDVEVLLGYVGEEDAIEKYLADHPTPREW